MNAKIAPTFNFLQWPARKLVFALCGATWVVRLLFLAYPTALGHDEYPVLGVGSYVAASNFMHTSNWAERWEIVERYSYGRTFCVITHLIWAYLFPSKSLSAFSLSALSAMIAMGAFAATAKRIYGERGFLLALLLASLSPYFLTYSIRLYATMQAVMWVCLAMLSFSSPRWSLKSWSWGGLCLGLAFTTHYGTGPAIAALAIGMTICLFLSLFESGVSIGRRLWRFFLCPIPGVVAALLPMAVLDYWSRWAGAFNAYPSQAYSDRLFSHENLVWNYYPGPYGMWLRHLFEFEPFYQIATVVALCLTFRASWISRLSRALLCVIYLTAIVLVGVSMSQAYPRAWVSIPLFTLIGLGIPYFRILDRSWLRLRIQAGEDEKEKEKDEDGTRPIPPPPFNPQSLSAPLGRWAVPVSLIALAVFYTFFRKLSDMPRLTFAGWPILSLGLCGLLLSLFQKRFETLVRFCAIFGLPIFLIGAAGTLYSRDAASRRDLFGWKYPEKKFVEYVDLILSDIGYPYLDRRVNDNVRIYAASSWVYPEVMYEEEIYKIIDLRKRYYFHSVDRIMRPEEMINGSVHYDEGDPTNKILPSPGTPLTPHDLVGHNLQGNIFFPRIHPYRGIELDFPASEGSVKNEQSVEFTLPAQAGRPTIFGFEWEAISPNLPDDTRLTVTAFAGHREVAVMAPLVEFGATRHKLFQCPYTPTKEREDIRLVAKLEVTQSKHCPPVSLYIRRPFIQIPWVPSGHPKGVSGFARLIEAPDLQPDAPYTESVRALLARAYKMPEGQDKELRWETAPWSGDDRDWIAIACSYDAGPACQLSVNGEVIIPSFQPDGTWKVWDGKGFVLEFKYLSARLGVGGILRLKLPPGKFRAGEPLELGIKVIGGRDNHSWFGVRDVANPMEFLTQ